MIRHWHREVVDPKNSILKSIQNEIGWGFVQPEIIVDIPHACHSRVGLDMVLKGPFQLKIIL